MTPEQIVGLLSDEEFDKFVGYCWIHSETPRALFHRDDVNRMIELAGLDGRCEIEFVSLHQDMKNACREARRRRDEAKAAIRDAAEWQRRLDAIDHFFPSD